MTSTNELYEIWADERALDADLERSLDPRGTSSLYDTFIALGVGPENVILDAGARDAVHAIELVRRTGCRAVAIDPVPLHSAQARARTGMPSRPARRGVDARVSDLRDRVVRAGGGAAIV
jgi:hypothetical protein